MTFVGGSMGGAGDSMGRLVSGRMQSVILLASTALLSPAKLSRQRRGKAGLTMRMCPPFREEAIIRKEAGQFGWALARMIGHITYLSDASTQEKGRTRVSIRRTYGYNFQTEFAVESSSPYHGGNFIRSSTRIRTCI